MDTRVKHSSVCVTPSEACAAPECETHHTAVRNCIPYTAALFSAGDGSQVAAALGRSTPSCRWPSGWDLGGVESLSSGLGTPLCVLASSEGLKLFQAQPSSSLRQSEKGWGSPRATWSSVTTAQLSSHCVYSSGQPLSQGRLGSYFAASKRWDGSHALGRPGRP